MPWGTQWGQMNGLPTAIVPWVLSRWATEIAFSDLLLGTLRPSGGLALVLRRLGVG